MASGSGKRVPGLAEGRVRPHSVVRHRQQNRWQCLDLSPTGSV